MESDRSNNNEFSTGIEPIRTLKARLDFESDAWKPGGHQGHGQGWHQVFDQTRDLSAYHRLAISPFRLEDLLRIWGCGSGHEGKLNVILDCEVTGALVEDALDVLRDLHRHTVNMVGPDTAEGLLVLDDKALEVYTRSFAIKELALVRVDGPVDRGDIMAMLSSSSEGRSPLDVELRGIAATEFTSDGPTILESRQVDVVASALGTDLARYVESILRVPNGEIPPPPDSAVMRLLAKSGSILIRPQDTELLGNNVDVGICTSPKTRRGSIDTSLVFCRPEGTWHAREAA
ncbi:MAG: hypothetical protein P8J45_01660 [Phycisphaerales bacterium]|jgi:hypothetical protein|nr:hypothetical protein [Phycisphaerales bacterium]